MSFYCRTDKINPHTGKPCGLIEIDEFTFTNLYTGQTYVRGDLLFTEPPCPVTFMAQTAAEYETTGRPLLWNGLKTFLIRWFLYRRDLNKIRERESEHP